MTHPTPPEHSPRSPDEADAEWTRRFGGAVIDPEGNEIPITEDMIQEACAALEQQSITGLHARTPSR